MNKEQALKLALEALEMFCEYGAILKPIETRDAIREALALSESSTKCEETSHAQPEQDHVDSAERAGAYMDARLWEFIDMAAAWPEAKPDSRTWGHVLVYAPKQPEQEPIVRWICKGCGHEYMEAPSSCDCMDSTEYDRIEYYTTPPSNSLNSINSSNTLDAHRKPLTDDEIQKCYETTGHYQTLRPQDRFAVFALARAIEAAHGIKE